jgi:hypothetical protein
VSSGWEHAFAWLADRDAIDGRDDDDYIDLGLFLDDPTVPGDKKEPFDEWMKNKDNYWNQNPKCDCGSEKTYGKESNVHTEWCSKARR